jgi:hypothetical protein
LYLDEQREQEPHCTIQWSDTKKIQIIPLKYIHLPPLRDAEINVTYTIVIDGVRRCGTVLATGNMKIFLFELY